MRVWDLKLNETNHAILVMSFVYSVFNLKNFIFWRIGTQVSEHSNLFDVGDNQI